MKKVIRTSIAIRDGRERVLRVGNLDVRRDFGHAPDYVEAMWGMLQQDQPADFLICSGKSILLRDIVEYIFKQLEIDRSLIIEDRALFRPNEIIDIYGDNSKAKSVLNWSYDTSFYEILDQLIELEQRNA